MTTLNARLTRRAFLGGAAAFGAAAMASPKNAFADPTSADVQAQADEARQKLNSMREQLGINYKNLSEEEFRWLIRILKKSKKMGTPISQRKKR